MAKINYKKELYEAYKMLWMLNHGYNLRDLMEGMNDVTYDYDEDDEVDILDTYNSWEMDAGFGGAVWACYKEFLDTEFKDADYVYNLISLMSTDKRDKIKAWYDSEMGT